MSDPNAIAQTPPPAAVPAGWYPHEGQQRYWDGAGWTDHFAPLVEAAPAPRAHRTGPATAASLNVKREVIYNREQKGHSLILHLLLGVFVLWIPAIYITVSPNHYWHA